MQRLVGLPTGAAAPRSSSVCWRAALAGHSASAPMPLHAHWPFADVLPKYALRHPAGMPSGVADADARPPGPCLFVAVG